MKFIVLAISFTLAAASASAEPFQVTLDTSSLLGLHTFGFGLTNFDAPGNIVSLSGFDLHGGNAVAGSEDCTLGGLFSGAGCAGDIAGGLTLADLDPAAFFTEQFTAGSALSFMLNTSNSFSGGGIPDQLAMYICDAGVTTCYSDDVSGAMLLLDLSGGVLSPTSFVTFGAGLQGLAAPVVTLAPVPDPTTVPEPSTVVLLGSGAAMCVHRLRRRRA